MQKKELINYLNNYLKINDFIDKSKNGLQVDNTKKEIIKIGYSVDASTYIFDKAAEEKIDMIICHHGMFWGYESVLTGVNYERAKKLIKNNIALYGVHLPLDAHEEIGNNIGLLKGFMNIFGLKEEDTIIEKFGKYENKEIGYSIKFQNKIHISSLQTLYSDTLQLKKTLYNFGNKDFINSIAFVSGASGTEIIKESFSKNYDLFVTGEVKHSDLVLSKELGQSIMIGGHYETEKIGPKLLAYHLKDKFGVEIIYLDEKY
ncbi:MAG: Nif3-like dinuclear metal center hexameric protein [Candidatus Gracilibacteria bacterium]|nr:Nif3-like dinuclear metal center hexameric protein [Candidatus Gracilibacteria bacterium]